MKPAEMTKELSAEKLASDIKAARARHAKRLQRIKIQNSRLAVAKRSEGRAADMIARRIGGATLKQIAGEFGISITRTREILRSHGWVEAARLTETATHFLAKLLKCSDSDVTPEAVAKIVWIDALKENEWATRRYFPAIHRWLDCHGLKPRPYNDTGMRSPD